jgi:SAM-dependent methyltransferase
VAFSEEMLALHGSDPSKAVGWPRGDASVRYRVMLEMLRPGERPVSLLDFGCGLSGLLDFIRSQGIEGIEYSGLDLSDRFLEQARAGHPGIDYYKLDLLAGPDADSELPVFDYVVMNGIFTYLGDVGFEAMFDYLRQLVRRAFAHARLGLAFNVATKQVDWERDDLFHLPVDLLLTFLSREVSRHVVIRHDYGLYEYTAYVYRRPSAAESVDAKLLVDGRRP